MLRVPFPCHLGLQTFIQFHHEQAAAVNNNLPKQLLEAVPMGRGAARRVGRKGEMEQEEVD